MIDFQINPKKEEKENKGMRNNIYNLITAIFRQTKVWGFLSFLISDPLGLISGTLGLVSDLGYLKSDYLRLKSDPWV